MASPIDFQSNFSRYISPSKNKPLKRAFGKYKPRGLFSEFYGILFTHKNDGFRAISVTEQGCAAPIFKVESHASDRRWDRAGFAVLMSPNKGETAVHGWV